MAGDYEQASLLQRIASGGVDVAGTILKQYREGVQWRQDQQAVEQKSKLADIAITQGQQQIESTNLLQKQKQLEVDKLTSEAPYFDSNAALDNQKRATDAGVAVLDMNLATLKLNKEMDNVPIEERAGHLQSFKQILTQLESLPPEQYSAALSSTDLKDMKNELYLTGDKEKDTPMRKAGIAAADAIPELQKAKLAAESAKYVADVGLQKTAMTVAGRERTTQIMADAKVRASTTAAGLKGMKVTKSDTDTGVALVVGRADTDFPGVKKEGIVGMGAQVALLGNAIMKEVIIHKQKLMKLRILK